MRIRGMKSGDLNPEEKGETIRVEVEPGKRRGTHIECWRELPDQKKKKKPPKQNDRWSLGKIVLM